jgi:hypothetical protein
MIKKQTIQKLSSIKKRKKKTLHQIHKLGQPRLFWQTHKPH